MAEIMQRPGALNITYTKGDDLPIVLCLGLDLTGYKIRTEVENAGDDPTPIPYRIISPNAGKIDLLFPRNVFGEMPTGERAWHLTLTAPDDSVRKFLAGTFKIVKN